MKDGCVRTLCGRYRDVVSCGPGEELVIEGGESETRDRLALYCVSPHGEAAWVVDQYRRLGGHHGRAKWDQGGRIWRDGGREWSSSRDGSWTCCRAKQEV